MSLFTSTGQEIRDRLAPAPKTRTEGPTIALPGGEPVEVTERLPFAVQRPMSSAAFKAPTDDEGVKKAGGIVVFRPRQRDVHVLLFEGYPGWGWANHPDEQEGLAREFVATLG